MEPYHFIGPILAALTFLSLGGMALVGVRMWVRRRGVTAQQVAELLREQLHDDIREEVARALGDREADIEELHERLDFAERLLTQGRQQDDADAHADRR